MDTDISGALSGGKGQQFSCLAIALRGSRGLEP